jgi:non-ribosomal peptide synthetase component E (peptide arylation enzyme)
VGPSFPIKGVSYQPAAEAERLFANRSWLRLTAGEALRQTALAFPQKLAMVVDNSELTFAQLDRVSESVAAGLLDLGLVPGDRALFQIGSTPKLVFALYGCFKAGIIPVCTIPQYREVEVGQLAALSEARAYFVQADVNPSFDQLSLARKIQATSRSIRHLIVIGGETCGGEVCFDRLALNWSPEAAQARVRPVAPAPEDVMVFQLSGGSTGIPKIIPIMHGQYLGWANALSRRWELKGDDVALWALSLIHNAGMLVIVLPLALCGRTAIIHSKFEPERFLASISERGVTFTASIGPILPRILALSDPNRRALGSLRHIACLSGAQALERHLGVSCSNHFGMTEGMAMASSPHASSTARHGTVGCPVVEEDSVKLLAPGSEDEVQEGKVGELCFRGASMTLGYYNNPQATADAFTADGYLRTGDLLRIVSIDGRRYYVYEGRLRDNINRGGEKISAEEVESFIIQHPAVADARVVAMPDPIMGEKACAFVIARPGASGLTITQLGDFLTAKGLAKFKLPERVEMVSDFPVTGVGKVDKHALRSLAQELATRDRPQDTKVENH